MVRSSTSTCFKLLACGSDSAADNNDLPSTESKSSTDKRGWSFRKRSARHRVLSNTVISEPPSTGNKESPTTFTNECQVQTNSTVPDKISASQQTDETPHPFTSAEVNLKAADTPLATENASDNDFTLPESIVVVIQTAIRAYLAQRALCKLKNVVKLQAAVRGLLVRRQAVGTLRCVQAIVKMQALVRARRVRLSIEGLAIQDKPDGELETDNQRVKPLVRENSVTETNQAYCSTKNMLTNGFARQLLDSTPKKKPIRIKCDPSRPDSAWKWLERWMAVSSSDVLQPQQPQLSPDSQEEGENKKLDASEARTVVQAEIISGSADVKSDMKETEMPEGEENLITYNADDFEFHAYKPTSILDKSSGSAMEEDMEQHQVEDGRLGITEENSTKIGKVLKETPESSLNQVVEYDATSQTALHTVSDEPEADSENPKRALKRGASEQLETEGKKFAFVTRKSSNPAFAAVQSKFEELSSTVTSGRPIGSTFDDAAVESRLSSPPPQVDSVTKKMDVSMTEDSVSHDPKIQIGGSECGTELSITSTLDSPDRSEAEGGELAHELRAVDKGNSDLNGTADGEFNCGNSNAEAKNISYILETLPNASSSGIVQPTNLDEVNQNSVDSVAVVNFKQVKQEPSEQIASDMHVQLETVTEQPADNLSPEGSPRSHMTAPESHGTPSSQVSVSAKRDKSDTSTSAQKRRSKSVGKRSLSNQNNDSGVRSSTEHLPKDSKNGKRRNSFDHEPRVSSSNSLPSYMQATESARAKAHANNSPKSSPDVLDKDVYMKKRHSLPVTNGKEDSPRMQRSMSQAQQNVKRNGTHSPHNSAERKWQR